MRKLTFLFACLLLAIPYAAKADENLVELVKEIQPAAITIERLADICEAMESAIVDISMEYEWYVEPPGTVEEIAGTGMLMTKGQPKYQWSTARPFTDRVRFVESSTIMNANGDSWDSVTKKSYNGKFGKNVWISRTLDGALRTTPDGIITKSKSFMPSLILSPLGFSVLRLSFSKVADNVPLSAVLRELARVDNTVAKVNGFNTIRADLLTEWNKKVFMRVYFSVDHGYTPIRYEHMTGGEKPEHIRVSVTIDINSLEQVAEGLWFPSSGIISSPDNKDKNVYQAIGKIIVNQGLTDEHFDIEFPPGTEVRDEIRDTEYIVKPTKEQKEKFEKEKQWMKEHADEMAALTKEGGRIYSAARLMRLGKIKDIYMMTVKDRKFPQTLDELEPYFKDKEIFSWLLKNVEYLAAGLKPDKIDVSRTPIAYDRTLLKKGEGTNVLFVNGLVKFCRPEELEKLGIITGQKTDVQVGVKKGTV